eukprot:scaffold38356_cov34-Phaeocystis_antarctica.AAC.1
MRPRRLRRLRHPRHPHRRRRRLCHPCQFISPGTSRAVRIIAAKSRLHSPPALFSCHVAGGRAALTVPTHRLVTTLLSQGLWVETNDKRRLRTRTRTRGRN